jgi:hypothetical protein
MPTIEELFRSKKVLSGNNEIATADVLVDAQSKKYKDDIVASDGSIIAAPIRAFQTKQTKVGKTEAFLTETKNSKDLAISSNDNFLNSTSFVLVNKLRKKTNLTVRKGETFAEQEAVGLRQLRLFSEPVIYGTDIFRINAKTTTLVTTMKNSAGGTDSNLLQKAIGGLKTLGNKIASKLGVQFPQTMIPSNIVLNGKFTAGVEPKTMETLATIKQDAAGNLMGKFLQQSVKGTPTQILTNLKQNGVTLVKNELGKLFKSGGISAAQQNLGKNEGSGVSYNSFTKYSNTVLVNQNDNILLRNDLSSRLEQYKKLQKENKLIGDTSIATQFSKQQNIDIGGQKANDLFSQMGGTSGTILPGGIGFIPPTGDIKRIPKELEKSGKGQQIILGKRIQEKLTLKAAGSNPYRINLFDEDVKYSKTVDKTIDSDAIMLRGDLSTAYINSIRASAIAGGIAINKDSDLLKEPLKYSQGTKARFKNRSKIHPKLEDDETYIGDIKNIMETKRGIKYWGDIINQKPVYESDGTNTVLADGTRLDDYDFVPLKFFSPSSGNTVNFRATISGLTESYTPSWDTNKFVGNPFNLYTYNNIERSLTFNFKVFSLSFLEHQTAWSKLTFLASLVYPQGYSENVAYVTPPIIKFTLGNMFKMKAAFIESLTFTIDDNTPWEIGVELPQYSKDFILPKIVDVGITLKIIESVGSTYNYAGKYAKRLYGFGTMDAAIKSQFEKANALNPDGSPQNANTNAKPNGTTVDASTLQGLGMTDYGKDFSKFAESLSLKKVENPLKQSFKADAFKPITAPKNSVSSYYQSQNAGKSSLLLGGQGVKPGSAESANYILIEPKAQGLSEAENAAWENFATTKLNS